MVKALQNTNPYLRGAPPGLPFKLDLRTLKNGLNFTLTTDLGPLDLLGEIPGARSYEELLSDSFEISEQDLRFRCVKLERLIQLKNAAGRPKDLESLAELRAILEDLEK
jgi:predicted nucleotidyltransferase